MEVAISIIANYNSKVSFKYILKVGDILIIKDNRVISKQANQIN